MKTLLSTFFCLNSLLCIAQQNININYNDSNNKVLIDRYQLIQKNNKIQVYRIQLASSRLEEVVVKTKNKYLKLFPLELTYEKYEQPEFKLVIGAYLNKKNAENKLNEIISNFKHAFIFQEEISMDIFKEAWN